MRSSLMLILRFAFFLVALDRVVVGWEENNDTMDYAIGIHFDGKKDNVSTLVQLINELAKGFLATGNKTRMAIVEFGQHEDTGDVLLPIRDGETPENVAKASKKIGQSSSYNFNHSVPTMANWTRDLIFSAAPADRINVPKLVTLIMADKRVDTEKETSKTQVCQLLPQVSAATESSAHIIIVEDYVMIGTHWQYVFTYRISFVSGKPQAPCKHDEWQDVKDMASSVIKSITESLQQCVYKEVKSECYENQKKECVENVTYELAFRLQPQLEAGPDWKRVRLYCFTNGSIECPDQRRCISTHVFVPTPSTSGTIYRDPSMRDDEEYFYEDDPLVINLKRALFGLGIAVAIGVPVDIFLLLHACRIRRQEVARQKLLRRGRSPSSDASVSSVKSATRRAWSVSTPPELSITPADALVKQYAKKKK